MNFSKNPLNLFCLILLMIFMSLACRDNDTTSKTKVPRRAETPKNRDENRETFNNNISTNTSGNENMTKTSENTATAVDKTNFHSVLEYNLKNRGMKKGDIYDDSDVVQKRILHEYGAIFLTTATPPAACMYKSAEDVNSFQSRVGASSESIAGANVELQPMAMKALLAARDEAKSQGVSITPRDGAEAGKRGFDDTLRLWKSRFDPACKHWKSKGKLTDEQINKLQAMPINEQVKEVLELEKQGIYFNTFFNATILSSVAAPGTSQHLSLLAFDANEFENPKVRKILGNHGWFRTVKGDAPHFTFLGVKEENLKEMGLQKVETKDGEFWIPNV